MIRDPYEAPSTRTRPCGRRAMLSRPVTDRAISLDGLDDASLASLSRHQQLTALHLWNCEVGPRAIAALRSLPSLRELSLWRCKVTALGLDDALAALSLRSLSLDRPGSLGLDPSSLLPRCTTLEGVTMDFAGEADTPLLDALTALPSLRWLRLLYAPQMSDEALPRLASIATLEDLSLHGCEAVTGETLDALAPLPRLRSLRLVTCGLARDALRPIAALTSLRALDLGLYKHVSVSALRPLRSLEVLRLSSTQLGAKQIDAIGDLSTVTHLELGSCDELDDARLRRLGERLALRGLGVASTRVRGEAFGDTARWSQLEELDASFTHIDDAAVASLARLPRLRGVEMVYCNEVTAKGLARVAEFPALVSLDVQGVKAVDDALVDAWSRRARWDELSVHGCTQVTGRSVVALLRAHPDAIVRGEPHRLLDRSLAARERYDARVRSVALCDAPVAALVTSTAVMLVARPGGARRNKKSIPAKDAVVRLDPRGRALLTLAKRARLWDASTGAELPSLTFRLSRVDDAAFSADGSRLAVAGLGGTKKRPLRLVYLWDVATWTQLVAVEATHGDQTACVALSPDGSHVVVAHACVEAFSAARFERVLRVERPSPAACFDATGDAVLLLDGGNVTRAPLDGGAEATVMSWRTQLERAGGVTVLSERAELAANPDHNVDRRQCSPCALTVRGGEPVVLAYGGGYPGATGLVVGSRAVWIQCDVYGDRAVEVSPDAQTLALGYPQDRPDRLDGKVGTWSIDDVMALSEG